MPSHKTCITWRLYSDWLFPLICFAVLHVGVFRALSLSLLSQPWDPDRCFSLHSEAYTWKSYIQISLKLLERCSREQYFFMTYTLQNFSKRKFFLWRILYTICCCCYWHLIQTRYWKMLTFNFIFSHFFRIISLKKNKQSYLRAYTFGVPIHFFQRIQEKTAMHLWINCQS